MNKRKEYITNPARIVSFCVFIFWIGVTYATMNWRIKVLEETMQTFDYVAIQRDLAEIKVNISWIMNDLQSKK